MSLTGISPTDPTPSDRRELILAAGEGAGGSTERTVLLIGLKTSTGTETVDVLDATSPILDDADCRARFGLRSELYAMYRKYVAVDPAATIYGLCPTEGAGTAATCTLTVVGTANGTASLEISCLGERAYVTVSTGDTPTVIGTAIRDAINNADDGRWPITAANVAGVVTATASQTEDRYSTVIGADATHGLRTRWLQSSNVTVTKGGYAAGTGVGDGTTAFASAANHENFYWVCPWTTVSALSATDNQLGEALLTVQTQALPINGKEQIVIGALVGTQAQATTAAVGGNSIQCHLVHQEQSEWLPGMLAAHVAAAKRSQEVAHPCENLAGYCQTDNRIWTVPAPFLVGDRPTATEIAADLNNGVSPIGVRPNGKTYLVRDITSRSQNAAANKDYKAREGHIYSCVSFAWQLFRARYEAQKQPFIADDPAEGEMPKARTMTPSIVKGIMFGVIDELTGSKPLGMYDGPILAPDKVSQMKASVVVSKSPATFSIQAEMYAIEHLLKSETKFYEVGNAY